MKQLLSKKLHGRCQSVANKIYKECFVSGHYGHFIAECWIDKYNADYVNWKEKTCKPKIINGEYV